MGKNLVTSYAALGVGLAVVLTFGLTAISSVMEQPSKSLLDTQRESAQIAPAVPPIVPETEMMAPAPEEPPAERSEMQADVSSEAGAPAGAGGEITTEAKMKEPRGQEELARKGYSIAAEVPVSATASPFAGIFVILPYIVAAAVGSVVFVVTRKRVGW